jgi:hypothetical protein
MSDSFFDEGIVFAMRAYGWVVDRSEHGWFAYKLELGVSLYASSINELPALCAEADQ